MKKRKCLFLILLFILVCYTLTSFAAKNYGTVEDYNPPYELGCQKRAIIRIKERLEDLGYFKKGTVYTTEFTSALQERVILFQEKNNLAQTGVIDTAFLSCLLSSDAKKASYVVPTPAQTQKPEQTAIAKFQPTNVSTSTMAPNPTTASIPETVSTFTIETTPPMEYIPTIDLFQTTVTEVPTSSAHSHSNNWWLNPILILFFIAAIASLITSTKQLIHSFFQRKRSYPLNQELGIIDCMDGHTFEHWCANLLLAYGFNRVVVTKASGDYGADIVFEDANGKCIVQCKRFNSRLGLKPIQEVVAAKSHYRATTAIVMTNSYFSENAKTLAKEAGVILWDRDALINFMSKVNERNLKGRK